MRLCNLLGLKLIIGYSVGAEVATPTESDNRSGNQRSYQFIYIIKIKDHSESGLFVMLDELSDRTAIFHDIF